MKNKTNIKTNRSYPYYFIDITDNTKTILYYGTMIKYTSSNYFSENIYYIYLQYIKSIL